MATNAYAATYYWVGGTTNSNTSNTANWKTTADTCADSANVTAPGASDTVRFVSNCVNNATVDSALSVANFYMDVGYTGTTTNGTSLTVATIFNIDAGELNVINGGTVVTPGLASISITTGSSGTVTVDGVGSAWTFSGSILYVGNAGTGNLNILNGGVFTASSGSEVKIGYNATGIGTITISGSGSQLTNSNARIRVGDIGVGYLVVQNGGTANTGNIYAAYAAGSYGYITVDGVGSTWNSDMQGSSGYIGRAGTASLTISNGGVVNSAATPWQIGNLAGSIGTVDISGVGSKLNMTGNCNLRIGYSGTGTLNVHDGAEVTFTNISSKITVADQAVGTGTLTVGSGYTLDVIQVPTITAGLGTASFPPAQPTALATTTVSVTSIIWDWADATRATGYKVYRASDSTLLTTISSATSNWTEDSLTSNTQYSVYVRGTNAQGEGASSTIASAYTSTLTPTNLSGTAGLTTMDISVDAFTNPTAGNSGYYFSNSNGNNSGWVQTNSWQDTGLACSTPYTYSVKYRNGDGTETSSISIAKSTNNCGSVIPLGQSTVQAQSQPIIISTSTLPFTVTADQTVVAPTAPATPAEPVTPTSYTRQWQNILVDAVTISIGNLKTILSAVGEVRNMEAEASTAVKYTANLTSGLNVLSDEAKNAITNFLTYGTLTTVKLGVGERAGVINSFKTAFGKVPMAQTEWRDCIAIGNGRWPGQRNTQTETNAENAFKKIYLRSADRNNPHDDAAVVIIAYGLRPITRNLNSERAAIKSFMAIYGYAPKSASAWDIVRAIAYSGAKR